MKKSKLKKPDKEKKKKVSPDQQASKDREGFDYGGIPERDLKKNLGC